MSNYIGSYADPTITNWHLDSNGNKISIQVLNEKVSINKGKATLTGLPDEQYKVYIEGMNEIHINDEIEDKNEFKVDYRSTGIVYFHEDMEGQTVTVNRYYSRGVIYYPASRVWVEVDDHGNVVKTLETINKELEKVLDNKEDIISLKSDIENAVDKGKEVNEELGKTIEAGAETKAEIEETILNGDETNSKLLESISSANETKSKLEESISTGENVTKKLDETIEEGHILLDRTETIQDIVEQGNIVKQDLEEEISKAQSQNETLKNSTLKAKEQEQSLLDSTEKAKEQEVSINESTELSIEQEKLMKETISESELSDEALKSTINLAKEQDEQLALSTKSGKEAKESLDSTVEDSKTVLEDLIKNSENGLEIIESILNAISEGAVSKAELENVILDAIEEKGELDKSILEGYDIRDDLNAIIEGSDFEEMLKNIEQLKADLDSKADKDKIIDIVNQNIKDLDIEDEIHFEMLGEAVREYWKPSDFEEARRYGITVTDAKPDDFPSINQAGTSITFITNKLKEFAKNGYAQMFVTSNGDIWTRSSRNPDSWGEWYSVKNEIDKKADKDKIIDIVNKNIEDLDIDLDIEDEVHHVSGIEESNIVRDFENGITISPVISRNQFPSINEFGVSITFINKLNGGYGQMVITSNGDTWTRRTNSLTSWNKWYSVKSEIDNKADKEHTHKTEDVFHPLLANKYKELVKTQVGGYGYIDAWGDFKTLTDGEQVLWDLRDMVDDDVFIKVDIYNTDEDRLISSANIKVGTQSQRQSDLVGYNNVLMKYDAPSGNFIVQEYNIDDKGESFTSLDNVINDLGSQLDKKADKDKIIDIVNQNIKDLDIDLEIEDEVHYVSGVEESNVARDFENGITIGAIYEKSQFPSIDEFGVSITFINKLHGYRAYGQMVITSNGDTWTREGKGLTSWGEWYSVKNEIDKKADKEDASRTSTIVIANYDSHENSKKGADIVIEEGENAAVKINEAIQSLEGIGGEVKLMEGEYNLEHGIAVNVDGVHLTGIPKATILVQNTNWKDNPYANNRKHIIDTWRSSNRDNVDVEISNLHVKGAEISEYSDGFSCFGLTIVNNCISENSDYNGFDCWGSTIVNDCISENSGRDGFYCASSSTVTSCISKNSARDGFYCQGLPKVTNCISEINGRYGFNCTDFFEGVCGHNVSIYDSVYDESSPGAVVQYNIEQEIPDQ